MLKIDGNKLIRNACNYSQSTSNHQHRINEIMNALGIKPDITVSVRASLNNPSYVKSELLAAWAKEEIRVKRARKYKTNRKHDEIDQAKRWLKITKSDLALALKEAEADQTFYTLSDTYL